MLKPHDASVSTCELMHEHTQHIMRRRLNGVLNGGSCFARLAVAFIGVYAKK